jgi:hypothetical protein
MSLQELFKEFETKFECILPIYLGLRFQKFLEGKFFVAKFEFLGSFGMSLEGDCHEVEVTPNLEPLVTFGFSLEEVCHDRYS